MRVRDLIILGIGLGLAAGIGLWGKNQESRAEELPPGPAVQVTDAVADPAGAPAIVVDSGLQRPTAPANAGPANAGKAERVDTAGWTTGIVRGDIQLAVSILSKITTMTVLVEEARSAFPTGEFRRPHLFRVPIKLGVGTPTFEVRDIPFSEYPYVVSVYVPGLNGGKRTVTIDATNPLVDDIVLAITSGAPFTLLARDQDAAPFVGLDVRMLPVGDPLGRPRVQGTTDNFGSIVFEDMLAGEWQVLASLGGQTVGEPQTVTVQPGNGNFHPKVQGQGYAMTIPRGVPLQLQVNDAAGYGVADAKVTATAMDRLKLTQVEVTTNAGGRAEFTHLAPGGWHLVVEKDKFDRRDLQVTIKAGQPAEFRELRLRRIAW